ncbi:tyrosine-type recombinase/integrase [Streptomyces xiamenensis]|uniref:tyrosine-type recombinase/integrase n=1 Tax=Streptomyces xiamenensis TaxID=408015 RepID=UPI003D712AEA
MQTGRVFTLEDGTSYNPDYFSDRFETLYKWADFPPIRLHDTRHTSATLSLRAGVAPVVIQRRLGHATLAITSDIYTGVLPSVSRKAAADTPGAVPRQNPHAEPPGKGKKNSKKKARKNKPDTEPRRPTTPTPSTARSIRKPPWSSSPTATHPTNTTDNAASRTSASTWDSSRRSPSGTPTRGSSSPSPSPNRTPHRRPRHPQAGMGAPSPGSPTATGRLRTIARRRLGHRTRRRSLPARRTTRRGPPGRPRRPQLNTQQAQTAEAPDQVRGLTSSHLSPTERDRGPTAEDLPLAGPGPFVSVGPDRNALREGTATQLRRKLLPIGIGSRHAEHRSLIGTSRAC